MESLSDFFITRYTQIVFAVASQRVEFIETVANDFRFLSRKVSILVRDNPEHGDYKYMTGVVDSICGILSASIDSSLSEEIIKRVHFTLAKPILEYVADQEICDVSKLSTEIDVSQEVIDDHLRWMIEESLVVKLGNEPSQILEFGHKGEATLAAAKAFK